jgi:hypothetical protein
MLGFALLYSKILPGMQLAHTFTEMHGIREL